MIILILCFYEKLLERYVRLHVYSIFSMKYISLIYNWYHDMTESIMIFLREKCLQKLQK